MIYSWNVLKKVIRSPVQQQSVCAYKLYNEAVTVKLSKFIFLDKHQQVLTGKPIDAYELFFSS